jgi:glycosyltransferase involved in cell wall biosynthesis
MRVLVVTPVYPHPGSPVEGLFVEQHTLALVRAGFAAGVLLVKPWLPRRMADLTRRYGDLAALPPRFRRHGVDVVSVRYLHIPGMRVPGMTLASVRRAVDGFRGQGGWDLLQFHGAWPAGLAIAVGSPPDRPVVITLHIEDPARLWSSPADRQRYRRMLDRAAWTVGVGSPVERFLERATGLHPCRRYLVIPNGIDHREMSGVLAGTITPRRSVMRIISVCNLWPVKGVDLVLRALAALRDRGVAEWEYVAVGGGPEAEPLRRLAGDLGIAGQVRFTGRLDHGDAMREVAAADIFCLPSRAETFGMVYLEAMACGKPVIASRGTGAEDLVVHGDTGFLVPPDEAGELAGALECLLSDRDLARTMGEAGRKRSLDFTWESTAARYLEIYRDALGTARVA